MNSNEFFSAGRSPRSQLQGPRPPPLKVRKDSHKIKKPPPAPGASHSHQLPAQPRQPVIIYAVSPKVIHTNPSEFMSLVQRLTGPSPKYSSNPSSSSGAVSPAARYASVEKAVRSPEGKRARIINIGDDMVGLEGIEMSRMGAIPGILSPAPASLQPIPPTFFSAPTDSPNPLSFFHDLSPAVLYNNKNLNFSDISSLLQSPTSFISPRINSPAPSMDLFNHFFDL